MKTIAPPRPPLPKGRGGRSEPASLPDRNTPRKRQLTLIHLAKAQLGLDEDTYRAKIARLTNDRAKSAGAMSGAERDALLAEFRAAGWASTKPYRARPGRIPSPAQFAAKTMLTRVEQLLTVQGLPWAYAEAILRRQRGIADKTVACPLAQANAQELRGVIAALYRRHKQAAAKAASSLAIPAR